MRTKDLLMCVGLGRGAFKALQQSNSLPFYSLPIAEGEDDTGSVNINDRYWSDYLAADAIALKMMIALVEDRCPKEVGAKRSTVISREAAQFIAANFAWDLKLGLEDAAKKGENLWCAWAVSHDQDDGEQFHHSDFLSGSALELVAKLEALPKSPVRVIWLNASLIARQVYDWLVENQMPEASELAPYFKAAI